MKKALITGITGQDGFFLAKLLLEKGYEVHGIIRRNSRESIGNLVHLSAEDRKKIHIHWGDIVDYHFIDTLTRNTHFHEIYHLAAQSFVALSFENPKYTYDVNIAGTLNIANAIKAHSRDTRVYFAATSEMFGKVVDDKQNETSPFHPRSPYGVAKLAGFWTFKNYRESYEVFLVSGILFNHESEVRGPEFVTRKITKKVAEIANGEDTILEIGNMEARRDWGYARDYVEAMWLMLQQDEAEDFVIGTGVSHKVRDFVEAAFKGVDIDIEWEGEGVDEIGKNKATGKTIVKINPKFFRPAEVDVLTADPSKAKKKLGWEPKTDFAQLVKLMVQFDLKLIKEGNEVIVD